MDKLALLCCWKVRSPSKLEVTGPGILMFSTARFLSISKVRILSICMRVKCIGSGNDRLESLVPPEGVRAFIACARSKRIKGSSMHRDWADLLQVR